MKRLLILLVVIGAMLLNTACLSSGIDLNAPLELEPTVVNFADVTLEATPLTEQDLQTRYGFLSTYLIKYRGLIPRKNIHIVKVTVSSETTDLRINISQSMLSLDDRGTQPIFTADIFEHLGNAVGASNKEEFLKMVYRDFDEEMLYVSPGEPEEFFLLFLNRLERGQELLLEIPARTSEGDVGVMEITPFFPLFDDDVKEKEEYNSGIFLEDESSE